MPWRSRSSSASARGSGSPAKIGAVPAQRPCVAVIASDRRREKRRGRRSGLGAWKRRAARSGCQASFVTSPDQTSSQSAGSAISDVEPGFAQQVEPEERAALERGADAVVGLPFRRRQRRRASERRRVLTEVDSHPLEPGPDPHDLTGSSQLVELGRLEAGHAAREDVGLPERRREATPPAAARAPLSGLPADRSHAKRAGTGRGPPRPPARPPCAARRGSRGEGGGERPARTTRARTHRAEARHGPGVHRARGGRARLRLARTRWRSGRLPLRS